MHDVSSELLVDCKSNMFIIHSFGNLINLPFEVAVWLPVSILCLKGGILFVIIGFNFDSFLCDTTLGMSVGLLIFSNDSLLITSNKHWWAPSWSFHFMLDFFESIFSLLL